MTSRRRLVVAIGLAGAALAVSLGAVPTPDLGGVVVDLSRSLGGWTYAIAAALAFLETAALIGLVVPGETAVVAAGVVAGRGEIDMALLLALVWLSAAAGDCVSFMAGRRLGRPFLRAHGARLGLDQRRLQRVEGLYERHGGKAVIAGRFVGVARAVSPLLAGASSFPFRRFLPYSLAGALAWTSVLTMAGYLLSGSVAEAGEMATRITLGVAVALALFIALAVRFRSRAG